MNAHKLSRRTFYLAAVVAIVASTSGFALASVLSTTNVSEGANFYSGSNGGATGFSAPTLNIGSSPGACSASPVTDSVTAQNVNLVLSASSHATNCTSDDFAEVFTLDFVAPGFVSHTYNFTIYTEVGSEGVQTNYVHLMLGTGVSSTFTANVNVYVDYGQALWPNEIADLSLAVH
ncbi:MAG: hypothetical protein WAK40_01050 [Thermoplasmata archaeon]